MFYVQVSPRSPGLKTEFSPILGGPFDTRKRAVQYASKVRLLAKLRYEVPITLVNEVIETEHPLGEVDISYKDCFEIERGRKTVEDVDKSRSSVPNEEAEPSGRREVCQSGVC